MGRIHEGLHAVLHIFSRGIQSRKGLKKMTLILNEILDIEKVSFKDMDEFREIIKANVEFYGYETENPPNIEKEEDIQKKS